mmetsp:Transcript_10437/g.45334  ORF Transcript_10437/g.45334 Transcript_10437/m.45334 type:complete len:277 (-) Transcript_10437:1207-2037(-)
MRDNYGRSSAVGTGDEFVERSLDQALVLGIERQGCLIQDEDGRIAQSRSRDGDALLLTPGEFTVLATDDGIVAVRERGDEVVRGGCARGGLDLGNWNVRRVFNPGAAHRDVHADAGVEKKRLLRHDADGGSKLVDAKFGDVDAVEGDGARARVVEPLEEPGHGGLTTTALAHERNSHTRRDVEVDPAEHRSRGVGEVDGVEHDITADWGLEREAGGRACIRAVSALGLPVDDLVKLVCRRPRLDDRLDGRTGHPEGETADEHGKEHHDHGPAGHAR